MKSYWFGSGFAGIAVLGALAAAGRLVVPVVLLQVIDAGLLAPGQPDPAGLGMYLVAAGSALAVSVVSHYLLNAHLSYRSEVHLDALRRSSFTSLQRRREVRDRVRGLLATRAIDDLEQVSQYARWSVSSLVVHVATVVVTFATMVVCAWQLSIVALLAFSLLLPAERWYRHRLTGMRTALHGLSARLHLTSTRLVLGSAEASSYAIQMQLADQVLEIAREQDRRELSMARTDAAGMAFAEIAAGLTVCTTIAFGTVLLQHNGLSVGRLVAFLLLAAYLAGPARMVVYAAQENRHMRLSLKRILRLGENSVGRAGLRLATRNG